MAKALAEPFCAAFVAESQELLIGHRGVLSRRGLYAVWPIPRGSFQGQDGKFSPLYHEALMSYALSVAKREGV